MAKMQYRRLGGSGLQVSVLSFGSWVSFDAQLKELQLALARKAEQHAATVMPGFTHLQVAQPVTLGHHLMAYFEMFARDRSRLRDARARLNLCPLGSAALAGTGFNLDREATAKALLIHRTGTPKWYPIGTSAVARCSSLREISRFNENAAPSGRWAPEGTSAAITG